MKDLLQLKRRLENDLRIVKEALEVFERYSVSSPIKDAVNQATSNANGNHNFVSNSDIRRVIDKTHGNFLVSEIEAAVTHEYPDKEIRKGQIPSVIHLLKEKNRIKVVKEREGRKGATYSK